MDPTTHRFVICDVFTDTPLAGNQLAVFPDAADLAEELLGPIAAEMHFSETVFLSPPAGDGAARVRIFTPARELPFAGHPLIGAAAVAASADGPLRLETRVGPVALEVAADGPRRWRVAMSQPLPAVESLADPDAVLAALGVDASRLPVEVYDNGIRHAYVALGSVAEVAAVRPDPRALAAACPDLGVSCFAVGGTDGAATVCRSRMFWPAAGVVEDPATGSAAGPLAVHLGRHGLAPFGQWVHISQGAELGRPSFLAARALTGPDGELVGVEVAGGVVRVAKGELEL